MNRTKRWLAILLLSCLVASLFVACGKKNDASLVEEVNADISTFEILCDIWSVAPIDGKLLCYIKGINDEYDVYFDLDIDDETAETISDMAVVRSFEAKSDMYLIFKTEDTKALTEILENYRDIRITDFTGYAPKEEAKLRESKVLVRDNIVALLVSGDNASVEAAFEEALISKSAQDISSTSDSEVFLHKVAEATRDNLYFDPYDTPEEEDALEDENASVESDIPLEDFSEGNGKTRLSDGTILIEEVDGVIEPIDTSNIVSAYKSGSSDGLSDMDVQVLDRAKEIIANEIQEDMSMVEKEKAIHDYLTQNAAYDSNCLIYSKWYTEYADQPYGCLFLHQAICLGYTTTFKMFMDMLDIECIIVKGQANSNRGNHAWNMVKLDDDCWYTVDVTWDDPVGGEGLYYNFFNTTDDYMKATNHFWDKEAYPASSGGYYSGLDYYSH